MPSPIPGSHVNKYSPGKAGDDSRETFRQGRRATIKCMIGWIAGVVGIGSGATFAGFQSMLPESQLYGRSFTGLKKGSRLLALTYDDGPNDPWTFRLLEVLARHNVHATFFMLGKFVRQRPDIVRAVHDAGHVIGNHSYSHPALALVRPSTVRREIEETNQALQEVLGEKPTLFRPPFGGRRPGTFRVVRQYGLEPIMWRVTCYDWSAGSADEIVAHAVKQIRGGDVILLHDGEFRQMGADRSRSVEATDQILRRYLAEGYRFVTIPEMMQAQA